MACFATWITCTCQYYNNGACIEQVPVYVHLLTIGCLHNKVAVVTTVKSICFSIQLQQVKF